MWHKFVLKYKAFYKSLNQQNQSIADDQSSIRQFDLILHPQQTSSIGNEPAIILERYEKPMPEANFEHTVHEAGLVVMKELVSGRFYYCKNSEETQDSDAYLVRIDKLLASSHNPIQNDEVEIKINSHQDYDYQTPFYTKLFKPNQVFLQEPIKSEDLFNSFSQKSDDNNQIWLSGDLGSGKTILCQQLVSAWMNESDHQPLKSNLLNKPECVFLLPFKDLVWELNLLKKNGQLPYDETTNKIRVDECIASFLISNLPEELSKSILDESLDAQQLATFLKANQKDIVYIFDGYDEAKFLSENDILNDLLTEFISLQPNVIITSRPNVEIPQELGTEFNRIKLQGFSENGILTYIEKYFSGKENSEIAKNLMTALEKSPNIRSLLQNPSNLKMLCQLAESKNEQLFDSPRDLSLPFFCESLMQSLLQRQFEKNQPMAETADSKLLVDEQAKIDDLIDALGILALKGILNQTFYFSPADISSAIQVALSNNSPVSVAEEIEFKKRLLKTGFLDGICWNDKTQDIVGRGDFYHLSNQEFWVAKFIANQLTTDENSSLVEQLIQEHKYNSSLQKVWINVAYILGQEASYNPQGLAKFSEILEMPPHDIVGLVHFDLIMQCADAVRGELPPLWEQQVTAIMQCFTNKCKQPLFREASNSQEFQDFFPNIDSSIECVELMSLTDQIMISKSIKQCKRLLQQWLTPNLKDQLLCQDSEKVIQALNIINLLDESIISPEILDSLECLLMGEDISIQATVAQTLLKQGASVVNEDVLQYAKYIAYKISIYVDFPIDVNAYTSLEEVYDFIKKVPHNLDKIQDLMKFHHEAKNKINLDNCRVSFFRDNELDKFILLDCSDSINLGRVQLLTASGKKIAETINITESGLDTINEMFSDWRQRTGLPEPLFLDELIQSGLFEKSNLSTNQTDNDVISEYIQTPIQNNHFYHITPKLSQSELETSKSTGKFNKVVIFSYADGVHLDYNFFESIESYVSKVNSIGKLIDLTPKIDPKTYDSDNVLGQAPLINEIDTLYIGRVMFSGVCIGRGRYIISKWCEIANTNFNFITQTSNQLFSDILEKMKTKQAEYSEKSINLEELNQQGESLDMCLIALTAEELECIHGSNNESHTNWRQQIEHIQHYIDSNAMQLNRQEEGALFYLQDIAKQCAEKSPSIHSKLNEFIVWLKITQQKRLCDTAANLRQSRSTLFARTESHSPQNITDLADDQQQDLDSNINNKPGLI